MKKKSYLTSSDNFCGCGGQTDGLMRASKRLGIDIEPLLALNHWPRAIETYQANYPNAKVICTDISAADPRWFPSTDIHLTSPECTNHTGASGRKMVQKQLDLFLTGKLDPAAERSRATMWDVPRFAEYHNYNIVITENVVQARKWVMYDAWLKAMYSLGDVHKTVYANSKFFYPCPQSRDRMYVVFWKKGNKAPDLDYRPQAWCPACNANIQAVQTWKDPRIRYGVYGRQGQYLYCCPSCSSVVEPYYYAAFNAIDWSDKGKRIGDRKKPLVANTVKRIQHGLDKFGASPFSIQHEHSVNIQNINTLTSNFPTQTTRQTAGIVVPFIIGNYTPGWAKSTLDNFGTMTTVDHHSLITTPIIVTNKGKSKAHSSTDAFTSMTTNPHHGIVTTESFNAFISQYYGGSIVNSHFTEATGTLSTVQGTSIVQYQKPEIEDCYYRMIKTEEGKRIMAFDDDKIITGDSKEQFKQLGNAVTPPVLDWINGQCLQTLL